MFSDRMLMPRRLVPKKFRNNPVVPGVVLVFVLVVVTVCSCCRCECCWCCLCCWCRCKCCCCCWWWYCWCRCRRGTVIRSYRTTRHRCLSCSSGKAARTILRQCRRGGGGGSGCCCCCCCCRCCCCTIRGCTGRSRSTRSNCNFVGMSLLFTIYEYEYEYSQYLHQSPLEVVTFVSVYFIWENTLRMCPE